MSDSKGQGKEILAFSIRICFYVVHFYVCMYFVFITVYYMF